MLPRKDSKLFELRKQKTNQPSKMINQFKNNTKTIWKQ